MTPTPGSDEAKSQGCKCPRMDNAYGAGYLGGAKDKDGKPVFVIRADCPIHGERVTEVTA
jgi:hypothetical protein